MSTATKAHGMNKPKRKQEPGTTRNFCDVIRKELDSDPELGKLVEKARVEADAATAKHQRKFGLPADAMVSEIGRFVAPPCHACCGLDLPNRRTTYINGTERRVNTKTELIISRSIKCHNCPNTWTDYEIIKHKQD